MAFHNRIPAVFLSYVKVGNNYGNENFCDRNINQIVPLRVSRT